MRSAYILFEDGSEVNRGVNIDFCVSNVLSAEIQKEGAERIPPRPPPRTPRAGKRRQRRANLAAEAGRVVSLASWDGLLRST